jgi:hypothetical protein
MKYGGTSEAVFNIMSKLHLTTCSSTVLKLLENKSERKYQSIFSSLKTLRDSSQHFLLLSLDNFNAYDFSAESRERKLNTQDINTLTNIFKFFPKIGRFIQMSEDQKRISLMPHLNDIVFMLRVQNYVCQNGDVVIDNKIRSCVVESTLNASLSDFDTLGNLPLKSSLLTTGIQGIMKLLIEGVFSQKDKEIALPLDPEFTLQMIRFNTTLYNQVHMYYFAIPIFHFMKHSIESSQRSVVFLLLIMLPIIQTIGTHKSKYDKFDVKLKDYVQNKCKNRASQFHLH